MENIGTLLSENQVLPPTVIPLFGILCPEASKDEECHFCMENITKGQFLTMESLCCGHLAHTECFKTWGTASHTGSNVNCAYCRTPYLYQEVCFLFLKEINNDEDLTPTNCCHTLIHSQYATELLFLVSPLGFEYSLECGQLTDCNRLWLKYNYYSMRFSNSTFYLIYKFPQNINII